MSRAITVCSAAAGALNDRRYFIGRNMILYKKKKSNNNTTESVLLKGVVTTTLCAQRMSRVRVRVI